MIPKKFKKMFVKKSTVVNRVQQYSYFPMRSDLQVELRRNIRERIAR